jgi:hypothetical protein
MGLVLGGHTDLADAGVDAVGQGEVDDAELAGKGDGRFGAEVGELLEAAAPPPARMMANVLRVSWLMKRRSV